MTKHIRPFAFIALALALSLAFGTGSQALAQVPVITQPVVPLTPQFNNPGPQIYIAPPGNPLQQLSPIQSTSPHLVSPGVSSGPIVVAPIVSTSRQQARRHLRSAGRRYERVGAARRHASGD
jgi:hypothetical protein